LEIVLLLEVDRVAAGLEL